MIKAIFFDLGGVIFSDFFSGGEISLSQSLGLSRKVTLDAYVKTDIPGYCKNEITDKERWKTFVQELGLSEVKIQTCIDKYYQSYQIFPETVTFIENLKRENRYLLGVLSDQPISVAKYLRKKYQSAFNLFDPNLTIISAEVGFSKKDTNLAIYKLAIEKSKVSTNEILFVDNSLHNIESARSVGMDTFYFDIKNQSISILLKMLRNKLG